MNPELKRNIWLELTNHRLMATPLIILVSYYVTGSTQTSAPAAFWILICVYLFSCIVGAGQTAKSITTEIQNETWTLQRLTSMNPWLWLGPRY